MKKKIILAIVSVVVISVVAVLYYLTPLGEAASWRKRFSCGYNFNISANPTQVVANGVAHSELLVTISKGRRKKNKEPVSGAEVTFSATRGNLSETRAVTNSNGKALVYIMSIVAGESKVTATYSSCSNSVTVNFTDAGGSTTLFSDDFSGNMSKWEEVYDGYGTVRITNGLLEMTPKVATSAGTTHAPLVAAGNTSWDDYTLNLKMKTVDQLRTGSTPNPWEVGWVLFRYQDAKHFYYLIYKPNGVELGKFVNDKQTFLATTSDPRMNIGSWDDYKIVVSGNNIKVYINDSKVIEATDGDSPLMTGKIGLYNEDAKVYYDDVVVTEN